MVIMARPYWSGQLRISLVSFGISLIPATESKSEIHFHEIDRETGQRVRHQKVLPESGEAVENREIVKGYEYSKGKYIPVEPEDIQNLRVASSKTIDLEQFVTVDEIDPACYEKPYFVLPENASQAEAFAVVRKALEETGKAGIGKIALAGREHLVAICAPGNPRLLGLMAYTLRFAEEMRSAEQYFAGIEAGKVDPEQLSLARELIQRKSSSFDLKKFKDEYETALRELVDARLKHVALPRQEVATARGKVIDLMDALRRSVGEENGRKKSVSGAQHRSRRKSKGEQKLKVVRSGSSSDKRRKSA
ncbi:Ku protein [Acidobacterium capsulatum]|uniref:Non-homologous end joining protein Ku n=2 Tax=Acidobacterium TaxID=33973 RepID=KU_ACIC5|nr:RecName: Full=Non-homologous end joining protein Ku [Acidobacterium capsulatum ATCC 51196]ACO34418.1 Ku protein [Acidobacterium capsulatum ATCC 51196]HCT59384.1 Ku protein [Acidobacterium sp.]